MDPSPYRDRFSRLLASAVPLTGRFYRALPPDPGGSALEPGYSFAQGNRYNPPGALSALYLADDDRRSRLEANLSRDWCDIHEVEIKDLPGVVILSDANLKVLGLTRSAVTRSRLEYESYQECRRLGVGLFQAGGSGLLFPSALAGTPGAAMNLALYPPPLIARAGIRVVGVRPASEAS